MTIKRFPLHEKALALSKDLRRLENELIAVLQEIEAHKIYLELGFSSLFKYATTSLGMSEANAYTFIAVARKAKRIPLLQKSLDEASVSVSKVKHILAVLEPENSKDGCLLKNKGSDRESQANPKKISRQKTSRRPQLPQAGRLGSW